MMDSGEQFVMTDGTWPKHKWCVVRWVSLGQSQLSLEDNMGKVCDPQSILLLHIMIIVNKFSQLWRT